MTVRMQHDGVSQVIEVPEISVKTYERSGWKVVDGQAPALDETKAAAKGRRHETGEN